MDLYTNLLDFINQANKIKPLEQEFGDLIPQAPEEKLAGYIPTVNPQPHYISPLSTPPVQTQQIPRIPIPQFRPVISTKKIKSSQPTLKNFMSQGKPLPQSGNPQMLQLIKKYFPPNQWSNAVAIMNAESGGRNIPSQFNKYGTEDSHGAFQINLQAHPQMRGKVNIPEENVKYAAQLFNQSGWVPWFNSAKKLGLL